MLQSIDTLIAFVVIMTVASLFVTLLVQMASAALSLRGKNLANALAVLFQTLAPSLGAEAHRLAAEILSDPLLSDSTRTTKNKATSFAATVVNRVVPWNFRNIKNATRLASAVRSEEVYAALLQRAKIGRNESAQKICNALSVSAADVVRLEKYLGDFRALADELQDPLMKEKLLAVVAKTPANLLVKANASFDEWFTVAQDRAQQWFQLHIRGLTIGASFLIAFLLQLDAVEIFHQVSVSPATRNALVAASANLVQQVSPSEKEDLLKDLQERIDATGFDFVPPGFWRWPTELPASLSHSVEWYYAWSYWRHAFGMALFAALLTLGAPYWYNLLKNLTSLRPALARAIGQEEASKKTPNE